MNDNDNIADDFRHPSRWPVVFILLIVACFFGVRWYVKGHKENVCPAAKGTTTCSVISSNPVSVISAVKAGRHEEKARSASNTVASEVHLRQSNTVAVVSSPVDSNLNQVVQQAIVLEGRKALLEARIKYMAVLKEVKDPVLRADVEQRLGRVNCELILTPESMPEKQQYVVKSGDSLDKIAKKFGTTVELIYKSNLLSSEVIKAGDRLMVLTGKFAIRVRKAKNDMVVTLNNDFFARYAVGTGKFGKTPIGSFLINDKIREPVWWRPDGKEIPFGDPENILGTRWMSIKASGSGTPDVKGYGIHGTWDESSIGKAESAGCIRMKNSEVEQLFMMVPLGTVVTIAEQ